MRRNSEKRNGRICLRGICLRMGPEFQMSTDRQTGAPVKVSRQSLGWIGACSERFFPVRFICYAADENDVSDGCL